MRIQKIILELKQTVKEGNKSVLGVVLDYLSLRKRKWLLWNEYYNYELDRQSSEFRKNFLGAIEQGVYLELLNPFKYYILARNKYLTHLVLEKENIPMPELYCYYNPERGVTSDGNVSNDLFSTIQVLKAKNVKKCVVKETEGSHGDSVFAVNGIIYEGDDALMEIVGGRTVRLSTILRQYPLLFEQRIIQTKQLSDFNPTSVNTIRFMTVVPFCWSEQCCDGAVCSLTILFLKKRCKSLTKIQGKKRKISSIQGLNLGNYTKRVTGLSEGYLCVRAVLRANPLTVGAM